jgi:CRISPR-associated protein Cas2
MSRDSPYLLVYDITENRLRTRVAKVVEGYGVRVQKSAFECRLTRGMRARLWEALARFELGPEDAIALYRLAPGAPRALARRRPNPQSEERHCVIL